MTENHPGQVLTELIAKYGLEKTKVAEDLGISRQHLYDIMREKKSLSVPIAVKLGHYFGNGTEYWMAIRTNYLIEKAENEVDTSEVQTLKF